MKRLGVWLVAPLGAVGMVTGFSLIHPSSALAPAVETPYSKPPQLPSYESLDDLYAIRDRLRQQYDDPDSIPAGAVTVDRRDLLQALQAVEIRIQIEETAIGLVSQARDLSQQATQLEASAGPTSAATLEEIYTLWQQAVALLEQVPDLTLAQRTVPETLNQFQRQLATARYKADTAKSAFLKTIAQRTGLPSSDVHITVCHIEGECRRWNGNVRPASPASLIKLPVAIALMDKITAAGVSLDTKIQVSPGNYTEDASDIWTGEAYTLRKLMARMINQSSNIATNQLIDYVGRSHINQVMDDRGYRNTFVDYKLVGEYTYPDDAGTKANTSTTDELTDMMRQIYRQQHPGDEALMEALMSQEDLVLGHDGLRGTRSIWMGEKTGQNSEALGTTYAFQIDNELYFATLIFNYSGDEFALRQCVKDIALHIMENGGL